MCNFFSFCTQPSASSDFYYFDWQARLNMNHVGADSHSHICAHFGINEDQCNKWEYNPLTKELYLDMQNDPKTDTKRVKKWVDKLDWNTIVAPLIIKPIINPLELPAVDTITDEQIGWLKDWDSVGASVRASVWASVWDLVWASVRASVGASVGASVWASVWDLVGDSVGASVRASVWASVWDLVWASVRASVGASVGASVWASVWDLVGDSVGASVGAYISSFFAVEYNHDLYNHDLSSAIKLWESGLVPSFDGTTWRLHSGKKAEIVYEWKKEVE